MTEASKSTKDIIFDTAIEMFSEKGYENISMRDLAKAVGIQASSIYNHYGRKEEILDAIFQFYEENMYMNRISFEDAKKIVKTGTAQDIAAIFLSSRFGTELMGRRMMLGTKIIYARMFSDEKAKHIFRKQNYTSMQFTKDVIDYGIEIGRIAPFDTEIYAYSYVAQFVMIGLEEFTKGSYTAHESERGPAIARYMADALPMLG